MRGRRGRRGRGREGETNYEVGVGVGRMGGRKGWRGMCSIGRRGALVDG